MPAYEVYSDGACSGNPGPGGWGAIVILPDERRQELSGFEPRTTNNRMELTGALQGLSSVPNDADVTIYSDSEYVIKGACTWLDGWKRRGWKTAGKTEVLNRDLWECIDAERARLHVSWEWVRGHNGHVLNERADSLARKAIVAHGAPPPTSE
ncbi:MAG TPA: ribonuclease HI [Chloroflexota bacterium]